MASDAKVHLFEDVEKHNIAKDCWLVISGKVYDVTKFLEDHPGGDEVLLQATGKDATDDFEDVGHSNVAREMMETYCIGEIDPSTLPKKHAPLVSTQTPRGSEQSSDVLIKILQFLVPLLILGLAMAVRHYSNIEKPE